MEDNKSDVFLIQEAITEAGIDAVFEIVADGQDAIEYLDEAEPNGSRGCPDLMILDLNLPRKHGNVVLKHLRQNTPCRRALVLVVSSSDSPVDRAAVSELGADGYFRKPTDLDEYLKVGQAVKDLLARRRTI